MRQALRGEAGAGESPSGANLNRSSNFIEIRILNSLHIIEIYIIERSKRIHVSLYRFM